MLSVSSDTKGVIEQQENEVGGTHPRPNRKREGSSTSRKRRSIDVLPDMEPEGGSRGQSVYHTPSSSLMHPSWATKASTRDSNTHHNSNSETLTSVEVSSSSNGMGPMPAFPESLVEEEEMDAVTSAPDVLPAHDVFGAQDGIKHFVVSAKTGENVDAVFQYLVKRIAARWKWQEEKDGIDKMLTYGENPSNVKTGGKNDSVKVGSKGGDGGERKGWRAGCC